MEFKENDFVRVPITKELIANFFTNGVRHFEVTGGITVEFECIGCVQDPLNAIFYLMFRKGQPAEGLAATQILPTYFRLNEKFIEKEKVKKAIEEFDGDDKFETQLWANDAGCSIAEFRAFRNSLIMSILKELNLEEK